MRRALAAAMAALLLAEPARANTANFTTGAIGTTGSQFLTLDMGARCIAMGSACTAATNDAYSNYWNPAGLNRIARFSAGLTYTPYVAGINYQAAEAAGRIVENGVLSGGLRYMDDGAITNTDLSGNNLGTFHPRDYVGEVGWAQSIYDLSENDIDVSMGVVARAIHSQIIESANGFGGDLGVMTHFYAGPFPYDLGFVAQNMGRGQEFDQVRDPLPFRMKLGAAAYPIPNLTLSLDGVLPQGDIAYGSLGAEYVLGNGQGLKVAFRGGFNSQTLTSLGFASALTGGAGVIFGNMSFDYAFTPMGPLGDVHNFSISYNLPAKVSMMSRGR